jgi:hypothetical protein
MLLGIRPTVVAHSTLGRAQLYCVVLPSRARLEQTVQRLGRITAAVEADKAERSPPRTVEKVRERVELSPLRMGILAVHGSNPWDRGPFLEVAGYVRKSWVYLGCIA